MPDKASTAADGNPATPDISSPAHDAAAIAHTRGPWAVSRQASRRVTANGVVICNAVLRNSGSAKRGIRHGAKAEAEAEANAHLIAAAPAFAEVVPDALDFLDQYAEFIRTVPADDLERHPYLPAVEDTVARLRASLAQSKGEE